MASAQDTTGSAFWAKMVIFPPILLVYPGRFAANRVISLVVLAGYASRMIKTFSAAVRRVQLALGEDSSGVHFRTSSAKVAAAFAVSLASACCCRSREAAACCGEPETACCGREGAACCGRKGAASCWSFASACFSGVAEWWERLVGWWRPVEGVWRRPAAAAQWR